MENVQQSYYNQYNKVALIDIQEFCKEVKNDPETTPNEFEIVDIIEEIIRKAKETANQCIEDYFKRGNK